MARDTFFLWGDKMKAVTEIIYSNFLVDFCRNEKLHSSSPQRHNRKAKELHDGEDCFPHVSMRCDSFYLAAFIFV